MIELIEIGLVLVVIAIILSMEWELVLLVLIELALVSTIIIPFGAALVLFMILARYIEKLIMRIENKHGKENRN